VTRVTIVGAGNMGRGIGTRVVAGGHQVEIVDRDPADARRLAEDLGGSAAALDPGAPFGGEVVILAVYYPGRLPALGVGGGLGRWGSAGPHPLGQARDSVDHVHDQVEAVQVVQRGARMPARAASVGRRRGARGAPPGTSA
jgi:NADP oxidoreductase coenzyme F420-dependent